MPTTRSATAKKGEIFSAAVRDLASDGRGVVAHPNGLTVFVPGVWPGEFGSFRFTGLQNRVGTAELIELGEASNKRTQPACPHHGFGPGDCGGCPWQFANYDAQLAAKQQRVESAAKRITETPVNPIWPSPAVYGYRNRAQLKTDGQQLGYVSAASHRLAPIEDCPILTDVNRHTLKQLLLRLPETNWRPRKHAKWTTLDIDETTDSNSVLVNQRLPFRQSNSEQNEAMRNWLADRCAALDKEDSVLELFCGSGNFTLVLTDAGFARIVAVDGSGPATESLTARNLPNVSVLTRDLFQAECCGAIVRQHGPFSTLVLDPPRDGFRHIAKLLTQKNKPEQVFYISCNLATLFRDLALLQELGYHIAELQPLDQAPHTPHIEMLAHLRL
ncbi:MAG: class I SAM-dependent RNA methyltransferase [Cellvibrionaceae bacterium]